MNIGAELTRMIDFPCGTDVWSIWMRYGMESGYAQTCSRIHLRAMQRFLAPLQLHTRPACTKPPGGWSMSHNYRIRSPSRDDRTLITSGLTQQPRATLPSA